MITTITVNYRTKAYVEKMLESMFLHHDHDRIEVFVVDNGSRDDLREMQEQFPQVHFIFSETNRGFAGGNNLAIERATGDYIALVNPDVIFDSPALHQIEDCMRHDTDVGIGGVSLRNLDGTQQACVWRFPTPTDQLMLLLKIPHILGTVGPVRKWLMKDFDYAQDSYVDQVMGAFFVIRSQVLNDIGPLDDGFFMWYEEVDFARRAKDAGWPTKYYADIRVRHKKGSSFENVATIKKQAMIRRSLRRYMRKHYGTVGWLLFTVPEPVFFLFALGASIVKPK